MARVAAPARLAGAGAVTTALRQAAQIPDALASAMADLYALDPQPVRNQLAPLGDVPVTLPGLLQTLQKAAARC